MFIRGLSILINLSFLCFWCWAILRPVFFGKFDPHGIWSNLWIAIYWFNIDLFSKDQICCILYIFSTIIREYNIYRWTIWDFGADKMRKFIISSRYMFCIITYLHIKRIFANHDKKLYYIAIVNQDKHRH